MDLTTQNRATFHVCIIGGGVVGLVGGILFRRLGFRVTILERDATLQTIGAGIQLHPNAVRVLQEIGVFEKITTKSVVPPSIVVKAYKTGQVLHTQPLLETVHKYGAPLLTIHRGHLRQILYDEALKIGVEIKHGVRIDVAGVDFKNGVLKVSRPAALDRETTEESILASPPAFETFYADLFIGADGGHSVIREALTGRKAKVVPYGKVVNRMLIEERVIQKNPRLRYLVEKPNITVWLGSGCQAVTYVLNGTFNIAFTWPGSRDPKDVFFGAQELDLDHFKSQLANWEPGLRELISLATNGARFQLLAPETDHTAPWVDASGKFCVVGDAAHRSLPYLGQGAATGIESIAVLAHLLCKAGNKRQLTTCLDIYQRLRKERTGAVIQATLKMGRIWEMEDGPLKEARDREFLEDVPSVGYPNFLAEPFFQEWLWGFDAQKTANDAWSSHQRDTRNTGSKL
ncbi:FAD binding domain-containing protein [Xylaria cf. heliscus]|nr:FAD binding domain-containing protein [Xylaria cf. heliscus]